MRGPRRLQKKILMRMHRGAGIAAGDCAAGRRDWARRKPVSLGCGHVVERLGVPDVGRREEQAAAGAGGRCGSGLIGCDGEAGD